MTTSNVRNLKDVRLKLVDGALVNRTYGGRCEHFTSVFSIKDSLMKTGALHEIRAQIRAEIYRMLQAEAEPPPPLSNENLIINELIREYLLYNGYLFTESVLLAETGQPQPPMQRNLLEDQLKIKSVKEAEELPLLYGLISLVKKNDNHAKESSSASMKNSKD